jgi:hypothetical protein
MRFSLPADLDIASPQPLCGAERERALRCRRTDVESLCRRAGIRYRVTGGRQPLVAFWNGPTHGYTVTPDSRRLYVIGRASLPRDDQERALRALEILAYGFHDYAARESVCGKDYFIYPVTPEHGRLWLSAIGRRGGLARTARKAATSKQNLDGGRRTRA